jgi:glycerol-3-phosphate dehydrogenase
VLNAVDARERGASIAVGWKLAAGRREALLWHLEVHSPRGERHSIQARALINAAGPWVQRVLSSVGVPWHRALRLVKGSHIVVPRLYAGAQAYTLQGSDRRVIFVIPYADHFTLVGTTDVPYETDPAQVTASAPEIDYLCRVVGEYLRQPILPQQIVWTYAGVRPLYDDGGVDASTVTRDYVFDLDAPEGAAPILSVFGGKLTTYRRLAEHALAELLPRMGVASRPWTRAAVLPGGDIPDLDIEAFTAAQAARYAFLAPRLVRRMCRAYGTRIERIIGAARRSTELGDEIGPGLHEAELDYLRVEEWARCAEDILWRRSKLGLEHDPEVAERINRWLAAAR